MNKKKKNIIRFAAVCVLVVGVIFCINIPRALSTFYDADKPIDKITLMSGNTGEIVQLNQEQQLKILEYFDKIKVDRDFFEPQYSGWSYRVKIMQGNKCLDVLFARNCHVNRKEYSVNDKELVRELMSYCRTIVQ